MPTKPWCVWIRVSRVNWVFARRSGINASVTCSFLGVCLLKRCADSFFSQTMMQVCVCVWNPVKMTFATGSGDGTIMLWDAQSRKKDRQKDADFLLENW